MDFKKFISGMSALAIAASAFAAITVTASATEFNDVTASVTNQAINVGSVSADYQIVFDADLYVPNGGYAKIYYNGGYKNGSINGVGPQFIFDAKESNGKVKVQKDDDNRVLEIIDNTEYSTYFAGHTVHVNITTPVSDAYTHIGNSIIRLSAVDGDNDAFNKQDDGKPRCPTNDIKSGRAIAGRNLSGSRGFAAIDFTVEGGATIKNAKIVANKISVTENAELVESYSNDAGAAVYQATITNDTDKGLSTVTATATATEGAPATKTENITEIAAGSPVSIAVVVLGKTAEELSGVSITLK